MPTTNDLNIFYDISPSIVENICKTLNCEPSDITQIESLSGGVNNLNWSYSVKGDKYTYRHAQASKEDGIDRTAEYQAGLIARELDIDRSLIYQHPTEAWKICHFLEADCFDFQNFDQVKLVFDQVRKLHSSGRKVDRLFDWLGDYLVMKAAITPEGHYRHYPDYDEICVQCEHLYRIAQKQSTGVVLCFNDFFVRNVLVQKDRINLIDWEYSGMGDYGDDIAAFCSASPYNMKDLDCAIEIYFGRRPTLEEHFHIMACCAFNGLYWLTWGITRIERDNPIGSVIGTYYYFAKTCRDYAEQLLAQAREQRLAFALEEVKG